MATSKHFGGRVRRRVGIRLRDAFSFLVASAWAEVFNDIFYMIVGDTKHIFIRIIQALIFTVMAVVMAIMFESDYGET
jgi:hypothetical protein